MIESSVARRYARALFSLADDGGAGAVQPALETLGAQLAAVTKGLGSSEEARALLQPSAPISRQRALVEALSGQLSPLLANFLRLLVERKRLEGLVQISLAFGDLVDARLGRLRALVSAPLPLEPSELSQLEKALAKATGKTVELGCVVEPSLIGGLTAEVGGVLYDGSLRTQLALLREQLKAG